MSKVKPFLRFDAEAEVAARFYVSIFPNSRVGNKFNEAVSFIIDCENQAEVDKYWGKLSDGGEEGPCGWLKDRFGRSWQVNPRRLTELLRDPDTAKSQRVMAAMLKMKKIDIAELERAAASK